MKTKRNASTDPQAVGSTKKRRQFSAEKKFQVYLETQHPTQHAGEILLRSGSALPPPRMDNPPPTSQPYRFYTNSDPGPKKVSPVTGAGLGHRRLVWSRF